MNTVTRDAPAPFWGAGRCRAGCMCLRWIELSRPCPSLLFYFHIHSFSFHCSQGWQPALLNVCLLIRFDLPLMRLTFALFHFAHSTLHLFDIITRTIMAYLSVLCGVLVTCSFLAALQILCSRRTYTTLRAVAATNAIASHPFLTTRSSLSCYTAPNHILCSGLPQL
jgi:hypothetical protein